MCDIIDVPALEVLYSIYFDLDQFDHQEQWLRNYAEVDQPSAHFLPEDDVFVVRVTFQSI